MAKFGWFNSVDFKKPLQEFEGEWLEVQGDIVCVMAKVNAVDRAVGTVRLTQGQTMKKVD